MAIKICFNDEIHKLPTLPHTLQALLHVISTTFQGQLPTTWSIYYIDSEGDKVTVSSEQGYQDLLETESKDLPSTLKLFVMAREGLAPSHISLQTESQFIEDQKKSQPDVSQQEIIRLPASQNKWEKTAQADSMSNHQQKLSNEVQPRARPQPQDEGSVDRKDNNNNNDHHSSFKKMHKAKYLVKKLTNKDLPESERTRVLEILQKMEDDLTPEERVLFAEKKKKWQNEASLREGDEKEKMKKGEMKRLFKRLRDPTLSESERAQIVNSLKEIEESLSPEQRTKFEKKKDKYKRIKAIKQQKNKQFKVLKVFKMLSKMTIVAQEGKTDKINKIRERAMKKFPEEAKKLLEPAFDSMVSENCDHVKLKEEVTEQFLSLYCQENREEVLGKWQQIQKKHQQRRESKRQFLQTEEGQLLMKKKAERYLTRYPQQTQELVLKMKETLLDSDLKKLCHYVSQAPQGLSADELIIAYRSQNSAC